MYSVIKWLTVTVAYSWFFLSASSERTEFLYQHKNFNTLRMLVFIHPEVIGRSGGSTLSCTLGRWVSGCVRPRYTLGGWVCLVAQSCPTLQGH